MNIEQKMPMNIYKRGFANIITERLSHNLVLLDLVKLAKPHLHLKLAVKFLFI